MPTQPEPLTEDEIYERMAAHPDLLARFKSGDAMALTELLTASTGVKVKRTTIRSLA